MSKTTNRVYEGADVLDSRDVIERIAELEEERAAFAEPGLDDAPDLDQTAAMVEWDQTEEGQELVSLKALADEASSSPDWQYGETLIADHYFQEYAEELAEDIGAIDKAATWPNTFIDWKAAAEALQQDYMSVEYGSTTYWIRS